MHVSDPSSSTSTLDIAIVPSLQACSTALVGAPSVQAPNPEVPSSKLQIDRELVIIPHQLVGEQ